MGRNRNVYVNHPVRPRPFMLRRMLDWALWVSHGVLVPLGLFGGTVATVVAVIALWGLGKEAYELWVGAETPSARATEHLSPGSGAPSATETERLLAAVESAPREHGRISGVVTDTLGEAGARAAVGAEVLVAPGVVEGDLERLRSAGYVLSDRIAFADQREPSSVELVGRATTDGSGRYEVEDLAPGSYTVLCRYERSPVGPASWGYTYVAVESQDTERADFRMAY